MRPADGRRMPTSDSTSSRLAVSLDAGDADDLAAVHGERHVVEHGAHLFHDGEPAHLELDLVGDGRLPGVGLGQLAADHQLCELAGGDVLGQHRRNSATCPNDGDRVGNGEHLVELVADEEHRDALGSELPQRRKQLVDLLGHEHRCGLVEDQDASAAVENLQDLDPLAVADAEIADQGLGLHVEPVDSAELGDAVGRLPEVDPQQGPRLVTEDHVLLDGQIVREHEVLMHHADADRDRITRRLEALLDASDGDRALVRSLLAVEDLHERRLAGAVLAHDRVDRTGGDREVDAVIGHHAGKALDDALELDRGGAGRAGGAVRRCGGAPCVLGHGTVLYYIWLVSTPRAPSAR